MPAHTAHHEDVQSYRRRDACQHHHHGHKNTKPHRIDAVLLGDWEHKGHGQHQDRRGFEDAAQYQEQNEHGEQQRVVGHVEVWVFLFV